MGRCIEFAADVNEYNLFNTLVISCTTEGVVCQEKRNIPIYFNSNYRTEMKLVPIIMEYCLLQFDALKFYLGVRLQGGSQPNSPPHFSTEL